MTSVEMRLPALDEDEEAIATSEENLQWVRGWMENIDDGRVRILKNQGITLQKINDEVVRCLAVEDYPFAGGPYWLLALMVVSFREEGIILEIDPYAVTISEVTISVREMA
jgi:hypothetical protein